MSNELKARTAYSIAMEEEDLESSGTTLVYLKSEVDKVIAEKDAEIARLKAIRKVHVEAIVSMEAGLLQDEKEIRRHKHKRCLAMAKWCRLHDEFTQLESVRLGLPHRAIFMEYRRKAMWWNKWHKRWLELAEKFKPKSTAQ